MKVTSVHCLPCLAAWPHVGVEATFVRNAQSLKLWGFGFDRWPISYSHTRVMCEWSELFTIMHAFVQRHMLLNEVKLEFESRYAIVA